VTGTTTTIVWVQDADPVRVRAVVERRGGRLAESDGAAIVRFASVADGLDAAIEIQQRTSGGGRIGVHVGDLAAVFEPGAPPAQVARRLSAEAEAGQILVSTLVTMLADGVAFEPHGAETHGVPWAPLPNHGVRVVVADDATLIRSGIVRLLEESGFTVVAAVADGDALVAVVDADPPDLVVTDIRMPPTNTDEGIRAAAAMRARHPDVAVLVLSQHIEPRAATTILDGRPAGIGYLLKERVSALDEFVDACRTVAAGGSVVDPLVTEQLFQRRAADAARVRRTDRAREVLGVMGQGRSNAAIADALYLGAKTVETHVRAIFQKLDLEETPEGNRRVQAVVRWLRQSGSGAAPT
jgi:DNA-binding NarL/FixJ family response regulator